MALSIKSDEADQLARELAAETGETLTEAVVIALRERLDREHASRRQEYVASIVLPDRLGGSLRRRYPDVPSIAVAKRGFIEA